MEEVAAAMRELAQSVGLMKTTVEESQRILRGLVARKPQIDGAMQEMHPDNTNSTIGAMEAMDSSLPPIIPVTETGRRGVLACRQRMAALSTRSTHPGSSPSVNEADANCVENSIDLNPPLPTRCSTRCSSSNKDDVQAEATFLQSNFASAIIPVLSGVLISLSAQQICILKPDKHTPTTCSTEALDIDTDSMRAKRDTDSLLAGLVFTSTSASAVLSVTTPPHPIDQVSLLLARPPPWPVWMASVRPWIMSSLRVEGKQGHHYLFWLLLLSACGQAECLGGVKGWCVPSIAPSHILTPLPEHVPELALPSLIVRLEVQWSLWCIDIPSGLLDMALLRIVDHPIKLPCVPGVHGLMAAGSFTKRFVDSPIFRNGNVNQAGNRSYHLENLHMCSMQRVLISVASNQGIEISRDMSFSSTRYLFVCPSILHHQVSAVSTGAHEGIFSWWQQQIAWLKVDRITKPEQRFKEDSHKLEFHQEVLPNLFIVQSTSSHAPQCNILQKGQLVHVQGALVHHLISPLQLKYGALIYGRRVLLTQQSLICTSDLVWCTISSPLTMPWDPGEQLRQIARADSLYQPVPSGLSCLQEEAQLLALFPRAPAWGQAGIEEGGNVTTMPMPTRHQNGYNRLGTLNSSNTKGQGVDEQTEPVSPLSEPYL